MIGERTVEGERVLTLGSEAAGGIEAGFAPRAGMVGCSLRHRGEELLGRRGGLRLYAERGKTMGIPLLHPWANRLGARRFPVAGREVDLDREGLPLSTDPAGLPIHGLLGGAPGWQVERHEETAAGGVLVASFDFAAHRALLAAFPFPHRLRYEARLEGAALTISLRVEAGDAGPVPISFGFHPYLRLPDVPRALWEVELPVRERLVLDRRMLPTGAVEAVSIEPGPLGERAFDDAYRAPEPGRAFALAGGGRRLEVRFDRGYRYAQVYAPAEDAVIAFEPMTAPTDALRSGADLPLVEGGRSFEAGFSVTVSEVGPRAALGPGRRARR